MKSSTSPGQTLIKPSANSCRTEKHGAPKTGLPARLERSPFGDAPARFAEMAPALLWLAFLFTGTLGLAQLFQPERENHCLDALLLAPLDRGALFLAKSGFNLVLMIVVEIVVIPLFWILFNLRSWNLLPQLFLVTLLGTIGFCV